MDTVLQIAQALVETLAVLGPSHPVHSGCRILAETFIRRRKEWCPDVAEQVGPLLLWLVFRSLSDPLQGCERVVPALSWGRVSCNGFSLGRGPSLHRLDGCYPRLRRLLRYHTRVRLLDDSLHGVRLLAFPWLPFVHHRREGIAEVSRLPLKRLL
jgi:hypothetical protein